MNTQTVAEIMAAFVKGGERVEKLAESDPLRAKGMMLGDRFTEGVAMLKGFPNPELRKLMSMVWDIVGNRLVPIAMGPKVPSLSFAAMGNRKKPDGIIFLPHNWQEMIEEDPVCQLGALVFVGSQAVDYYNDRVGREPEAMMRRARANEAEYLVTVREVSPGHKFNEWQLKMLEEFPEGLRSPGIKSHLYEFKPFVKPA